jgi:fumarylacetoacetate (FAA) hydrolase
MRFAKYRLQGSETSWQTGLIVGDEIYHFIFANAVDIRLEFAPGWGELEVITANARNGVWEQAAARFRTLTQKQKHGFSLPLEIAELTFPVRPPSFRDFYAFEEHVRNARKKRGLEMVPEWYDAPVFYFSNTACIAGTGAEVVKPPDTEELDYELEWAVVIGRAGRDIPVEEADSYIAGFTVLNDWSARDIQRHEMKVGLGPAKGKDFATTVGPYLVTPDELADRLLPDQSRGNRYDLTMTAHVNGVEYSRGNTRAMHWTFAELIARASKNAAVQPGDLIGSGTVGTGCIVEFPEGTYPWLQPGDVVRLEVERLGVLENRVTGG